MERYTEDTCIRTGDGLKLGHKNSYSDERR